MTYDIFLASENLNPRSPKFNFYLELRFYLGLINKRLYIPEEESYCKNLLETKLVLADLDSITQKGHKNEKEKLEYSLSFAKLCQLPIIGFKKTRLSNSELHKNTKDQNIDFNIYHIGIQSLVTKIDFLIRHPFFNRIRTYNISEVAKICQVDRGTVLKWLRFEDEDSKLQSLKTNPLENRIQRSFLIDFLRKHQIYEFIGIPSYSTGQVAKNCNVVNSSVIKWFDTKKVEGYNLPLSKKRKLLKPSLEKFLNRRKKL